MTKRARGKLCVVLLNYRTPELVIDCLSSLLPEVKDIDATVLVVDNDSQDGSIEKISKWIDSADVVPGALEILDAGFNGGFAFGNNVGIRHHDAEYYLLVNSDTLFRENSIKEMLSAIERDDKVGLLGPRLESEDTSPQESCFRYHHPISQLISSSGTGAILKLFPNYEVAHRVSAEPRDYGWISFACILIRREVIEKAGMLDEKFFMYFEDVEFCFRAAKLGWKIRNHPMARVVHLRGGSSPVKENVKQRKRQVRYYYESRTRYFYKLYGRFGLFSANFLWTLGWMLACMRSLIQRSFRVPACKREWLDIWTNFINPERDYVHPKDYK